MASTASALRSARSGSVARRSGLLVGWHLCSLDAPLVAGLWTWFGVRVSGVRMPGTLPVAMAVAVWILYAADRLLDARGLRDSFRDESGELEARHYFHWRHRRMFLGGIVVCLVALGLLVRELPVWLLGGFGLEGVLLVVWFGWIHRQSRGVWEIPKEPVVGVLFAAAVFLPGLMSAASVFAALGFAGLLTINGLFIRTWEHEREDLAGPVKAACWGMVGLCGSGALAGWLVGERAWPVTAACGLAAGLLLVLHFWRGRIERTTLRAAADAVLLTPMLFLFVGR